MNEYYVFATEAEAQACIDYINGTPWFPIVGNRNGQPDPDAAKTEKWADSPTEMASGEWCVPRIPGERLDALGVPQETRDAAIAAYGQDIRVLEGSDFPETDSDATPPQIS